MASKKVKLVLDADVIIHFLKAEQFSLLPDLLPAYDFVILDVVYSEISKNKETKKIVDSAIQYFKKIRIIEFAPRGESRKEYFSLTEKLGRGESACMVYCRDNHDALGSSNLKDICRYCDDHNITYLTTLDFLYYAYIYGKLTAQQCNEFIDAVIASGSKLPKVDITTYVCKAKV